MENDTWQKMHYFFWLAWFSKKVIIHKSRGVLFVKRYFDKNESALIWKETEDKSVQLVRGSFLQNPYFSLAVQKANFQHL